MMNQKQKASLFPILLVACILLASYSIIVSVVSFEIALQNRSIPTSSDESDDNRVLVTLIIESKVENVPLNVTYVVTAIINQTLESLLKEILGSNLEGRYYSGMGFYVSAIFGLKEKVNGTGWIYQELDSSTGQWVSPSVGVTFFLITHSTAIRFTFLP